MTCRSCCSRYRIDRTPDGLSAALHRAIEQEHAKALRRGIDFPEVDIVRVWQTLLGIGDLQRLKSFIVAYELMVNPVYPMPGLTTLLSTCRARRMPMGIISNAQFYTPDLLEWFLRSSLEKSGFNPRLIFLSYRFGYAKPSMVMFKRAADVLSGIGIPVEGGPLCRQRHAERHPAGERRRFQDRSFCGRCSLVAAQRVR